MPSRTKANSRSRNDACGNDRRSPVAATVAEAEDGGGRSKPATGPPDIDGGGSAGAGGGATGGTGGGTRGGGTGFSWRYAVMNASAAAPRPKTPTSVQATNPT